ncbi:MAG: PQQ-binding-like beta-propeller repeat protein [Verrucomicrobiales bacterium]|nr:PQQ-binding-like beta-propeller repeat protein [Verrucomicrobiales bacterium]
MTKRNQLKFLKFPEHKVLFVLAAIVAAISVSCEEQDGREDTEVSKGGPAADHYDWPLFRGDAEMQGVAKEAISAPLEIAWSYEPPVEEGKRRPPIEASPIISDGVIYIGSQSSKLLALDLESGKLNWSFNAEGPISAPAAAYGETVFFGDTYGFVYALDAETGEEKWRFETEGKIEGGINVLPGIQGKVGIFIGSHDYFLYCLDAANGEVIWKHETGNYVVATPSIINSGGQRSVSFGGCDGLLYVMSADGSGESKEIEIGSYIANTSAVRDGIAYVAHNGGEVIAIDIASGEEVWRLATGVEYTASPAVDETHVFVAGPDKRLVAIDRVTGTEDWTFLARRSLDSSPLISGDTVWQGGMDGRLYAVSRLDGSEIWQFELGTQIKASPAVSRGKLVLGGADGVVYAFRESDS